MELRPWWENKMSVLIGDYVLVLHDQQGTLLGMKERSANAGIPRKGEELLIAGKSYRVERVRHEEEGEEEERTYTVPHVFARVHENEPKGRPRHDGDDAGSTAPGTGGGQAHGARVLDFRLPDGAGDLTSAILPVGVVAAFVVGGYREQSIKLRRGHESAWRLVRAGEKWLREVIPELWNDSREAKRIGLWAQDVLELAFATSAAPALPLRLCA